MKQLIFILCAVLTFQNAIAQDNPFEELGYTPRFGTLSNGKYQEFHDNDTIVNIGSVLLNTKTKEIIGFVEYEVRYSEATLEPDIVSRWLSPDPLAEEAPDWTPYRFAFNNPLSFVDPDGLYEWRVNSETGEYERFGDKGGDKEQHIYFNDDKEAINVMKGATIYVGAVAQNRYKDGEISYAVSTKDLWSDLPDEYQGAYTTGDLVERYQAQQKGGEKYNSIRAQEEQGLARRDQIWNNRDMSNRLYEKYGSTSGLWLAVETRLFEEMIPGPSSVPSRAGKNNFSPTFKPSSTQLSNNSWIRFLQTNKGKYKGLGKNWINQAAKDYQALKEAGKL